MTYTMGDGGVIRDVDGASIPPDDGNRDWCEYLEWVDAGNTATPYEPPPVTVADVRAQRIEAFQQEADPLFFRWQAGEATEQAWLDARTAVQTRFPNPTA